MLLVAGIRAPNTKRVNTADGQEYPAEPLGDEAQEFVEARLLQRDILINVLGVSPQNQLVGQVKHPKGDIAEFELKAGLARCVDHHSTMLGSDMQALRQAEKVAKDGRIGLFKGAAAPTRSAGGKEQEVVVSRVQSADTLFLRYPDGKERRVNLSSVRQPKPTDPKQAPFGTEAKEFMRKKLIGKHVKVTIDGKRPATEGYDEREMATVSLNGDNVSQSLVEAGYASVLRHRMDDTDRSPIYDDLLITEQTAQQEGKGMWSTKAPETKQYVDYSESLEKAKRLTSLLSRQKRVPAIVDFVKAGSRFTLLIPRENAKLTFVLSGIQAPRTARNASEAPEPFGNEAADLAVRRLQQRDVEIDVEDNDKVGGFIGKLYVNRENFAKILLEEGYASVRQYSAEKSGNASELLEAERKAKESRKGLWESWDPSQDEVDEPSEEPATNGHAANGTSGDVASAPPSKDYRDIVITHIGEDCRLRIQQIGNSTTKALDSLMSAFQSMHVSSSSSLPGPPKTGDIVSARFSEDRSWYRARIRRNDREKKTAEVLYIDYGNSETLPWSELRPIPTPERFGTQALKPQAVEVALSFVQFPTHSADYMKDAQNWLTQRCVNDRQLVARVDNTDARDGLLWISIFDPKSTVQGEKGSINAEVLEEGLGMVPRKLQRWERAQAQQLTNMKSCEEEAKNERRGIYEYGDLTVDDN
jgi:staphylococcal nuclease domain-containing protein 1